MTIFKAFLKVLNKNKYVVLLYTVILLVFGTFSTKSNESMTNFSAVMPDIVINCEDDSPLADSLTNYLKKNATIKTPKNEDDALFYREVNYIINIDENFSENLLAGKNPEIKVKSTGDYAASLAEILLNKYIKLAKSYQQMGYSREEIISQTEKTLKNDSQIELTTHLDTDSLSKITSFYNFANYSLLAGTIFIIALILSSFKNEPIRKRTIISNMNYKKYNRILFLANSLFAIFLWAFYCIISFILFGSSMASIHGLLYMANSFIFTICALSLAILISNLVTNKEAINGIVNVVALGSSFLCGSFVPMEWLPEGVLKVAHILPSFWFINSNETIKTLETITLDTIKPLMINSLMMIMFVVLFASLSNIISSKKRKIA